MQVKREEVFYKHTFAFMSLAIAQTLVGAVAAQSTSIRIRKFKYSFKAMLPINTASVDADLKFTRNVLEFLK